MRILLDTHVWLWTQEAQERLGSKSQGMLLNEDNTLLVSSVSSLEIARLAWGGRLEHLFMLYERMRAPLDAGMKTKSKRRKRMSN